jgi:hypothetical protein
MAEPVVPVIVTPPAVEEGPDVVRALPSPAAGSVFPASGPSRPAVGRV